jgi:hypothetical protein
MPAFVKAKFFRNDRRHVDDVGGDVGMPMTILVCADAEPGSVKPTAVSITKAPSLAHVSPPDFVFARYPASSGDTKLESAILPDHAHKYNE